MVLSRPRAAQILRIRVLCMSKLRGARRVLQLVGVLSSSTAISAWDRCGLNRCVRQVSSSTTAWNELETYADSGLAIAPVAFSACSVSAS